MKSKITALCILLIMVSILSVSCTSLKDVANQEGSKQKSAVSPSTSPQENKGAETEEAVAPLITTVDKENKTDPLVIRNKNLVIRVKDAEESYKEIKKIALSLSGKVVSADLFSKNQPYIPYQDKSPYVEGQDEYQKSALPSQLKKDEDISEAYITIKIPANKFETASKKLEKIGKVTSEKELEEDVTEEYIDYKARLKNLQTQEQRYLQLFDRAEKIDDLLKIEEQISRVRGEIESIQARIEFLEKSADMSTITVHLYEPEAIVSPTGEDWGVVSAIRQALRNFVNVINFLIAITGGLLPFLILGLLFLLIVRLIWYRKKR